MFGLFNPTNVITICWISTFLCLGAGRGVTVYLDLGSLGTKEFEAAE